MTIGLNVILEQNCMRSRCYVQNYRCYMLSVIDVILPNLCVRIISRVLHLVGIRAGIRSLMGIGTCLAWLFYILCGC